MTKLMKRTISFIIWLSVFFVIFNIPGFKLNAYADDEPIVLPEIYITSDTTSVYTGKLPAYSVNTSTEHVSIKSYNSRTGWGYIDPTLVSWYGFGLNEPMAINDGKTRYGMRLYAVVDDGYAITYDTKVYFNGKEQQIKKEDLDICSWGAIIIIDLGYTKNIVTGKAGDDAVWTLDFDTGEMVISGTGSIYDSNNPEMFTQKVDNYSDIIKSVTYEHGITSTGNTIFGFCQNINSVTLSNTIEYIEPGTFAGTQFSSITIPKSVTKIDEYAFMGSSNLTVIYSGTEQEWNKINISKTENKRLLNATILYNDSEAGITKVDGVSVSLDSGLIGLNFYFDDLNKLVNTGAYISLNGTKYNISNANANSKWKYSYYVNAKEMGDKIKVEIIDKDGKRIPLGNNNSIDGVFYCSVNDYLNAVKKGDNSQLAQLANAMSDYGLCAQDYFGYNTPKQIPTISDGNYDKYDVITSGNLPTGVSYVGSSLLLKSSTSIRHYFNTNDKNVTFTVNGTTTAAVKEGTLCYIEISNINAVNLDKNYIITVSDGSNTYSIKYSALSYCQKANNSSTDTKLKRLVNSMYWYNQAANEYLKIM